MNYGAAEDDALLSAYYACEHRAVGLDERRRFVAAKMYVDFLWTLWGLTRVPFDGQFMQKYANNRYVRLKKNIETYRALY